MKMDEKEFLNDEGSAIQEEEQINLDNALEKIDKLISSYEQKKKNCEEYREEYKGDYENYDAFLEYSNRIKYIVSEIDEIKNLSNSPYFAHMFLEEAKQDVDMFVGYKGLIDEDGNRIIYDWRSKVGNLAYSNKTNLSYNGYNYKMLFKRKLEIYNRKIFDCVEEYNSNSKKQTTITDYFLRNVLKSKKNDTKFTDIIRTIQTKQNDIIRLDIEKNILCQGVAGSGKTAIIVHRLSYLLYNNPEISAEKYLFIAPNDNFKKELNELNIKLGINKIKIYTLIEFYKEKINYYLNYSNGKKLEIKNIINDDIIDKKVISNIYSNNYLESKYKLIEEYVYKNLKPVISNYLFSINDKFSLAENINNLTNLIENNIKQFAQKKKELRKNVEKILEAIKTVYQYLGISNKKNKYIDQVYYNNKINDLITEYEYKIKKNLKKINSKSKDEAKKVIEKFEAHNKYINKEIINYEKIKEQLILENKKNENNVLRIFKRKKIANNNNLIKKYVEDINNMSKEADDYKKNIDLYKKILGINNDYNEKIKKLTLLKNIVNKISFAENAYSKLMLTFDITQSNFEIFINQLNEFLEFSVNNVNNISFDIIESIILYVDNMITCGEAINIELNNNDKKNLEIIKNIYNPISIINICFDILLNNKYSFSEYSLKKHSFYRNDIFMILYILNKLDFKKQSKYKYLYIDEAQDYNDEEIKLLKEIEGNPIINIFGDYNQNISLNSKNRRNWKNLIDTIAEKINYFELNENYRNTINVVNYCNTTLKLDMLGIGIEGDDVEFKNELSLQELVELSKTNKSIIITNNDKIIKNILDLKQDVICHTVSDVKGLEFENAIVINEGLDTNNKYVAYTRTKNNLIIVEKVLI